MSADSCEYVLYSTDERLPCHFRSSVIFLYRPLSDFRLSFVLVFVQCCSVILGLLIILGPFIIFFLSCLCTSGAAHCFPLYYAALSVMLISSSIGLWFILLCSVYERDFDLIRTRIVAISGDRV